MMFQKILFVCASLLSAVPLCFAQEDAERNIMMGMQGVAQAANDPAVLAQLVRDMQVSRRRRNSRKLLHHFTYLTSNTAANRIPK